MSPECAVPKPNPEFHLKKSLLCVWNMKSIVYYELLKHGGTINTDIYCQQLDCINEKLHWKWPALVNRWYSSAWQYTATLFRTIPSKNKIIEMRSSSASSILTWLNTYIFPSVPITWAFYKRQNIQDSVEVENSLSDFFPGKKLVSLNSIKKLVFIGLLLLKMVITF